MTEEQAVVRGAIEVNYSLCTGCRLCEIACSMNKEEMVNVEATKKSSSHLTKRVMPTGATQLNTERTIFRKE